MNWPSKTSSPKSSALKVLVAEGPEASRRFEVTLLKRRGCQVDVAETGSEALEAIQRETYDLVLMDLALPGLSGLQTARLIREREQGSSQRTPIFAISGRGSDAEVKQCLSVGMDGLLTSPLNPEDLVSMLEED